jgi:hypothetical protein
MFGCIVVYSPNIQRPMFSTVGIDFAMKNNQDRSHILAWTRNVSYPAIQGRQQLQQR